MFKTIKKLLIKYLDDLLVLVGGMIVLYGLAQINPIITWLVGGLMLIGLGLLVGKAKAKG